ncbi:MAG: LysR substrate-binding domain-containing protein, partial [Candidatus Binatia bacterium]
ARAILADLDELVSEARGFRRPLCGPLRLGVIPTIAPYLLPRVLPAIRRRFPELRLLLREAETARLVELARAGKLDLLLLALEADLADLQTLELFRDPFLLALPKGHRLAPKSAVREADLAGEEVLLLEDGHCFREQALALCGRAGASELGDFRASSLTTLAEMVASGIGVTLLPELAVGRRRTPLRDVDVRPFRRPPPHRTIGLAWRPTCPRKEEFLLLAEVVRSAA